MDYFNELLDSYNKLKKRSFKLIYLSEAEAKNKKVDDGKSNQEDVDAQANKDAEKKALEVVALGKSQQYDDSKRVEGGAPWAFLSPPKGQQPERISLILGAGWPMALADAGGTPDVNSKGWKALVGYFKGGEDDKLVAQQDEEALLEERLNTLGSLIDSDPERFPELAKHILTLEKKNLQQIDELCRKEILPDHICKGTINTLQYIGGSNAKSLESKLFHGTGFIGFDEEGNMQKEEIGEDVFADIFKTNEDLLHLLERGDPDCDQVNKRMGLVGKGKVVLFTDPDQGGPMEFGAGGVVMDKGGLHQAMIDRFGCEIKQYQFKGSTNAQNETKGRFNEAFMGLITRIYAKVRQFPEGATKQQKQAILKPLAAEFTQEMQDNLLSLQEFAGETPMADQGIVLDSYPLMEEVERQLSVLTKDGSVKKLLSQIMVQMGGLLKRVQADDIIAGGTAQRLGGKVDNFFMYLGDEGLATAKARAHHLQLTPQDVVTTTPKDLYDNATEALKPQIEKTLKRQGLSVTDTTEIHLLSAGNKLSVGGQIKFGDLSLDRAIDIVMGNEITGPSPPENEEAWYNKLNQSLQLDPSHTDPQGSIATYFSPIKKLYDSCRGISEEIQYVNTDGQITLTNPSVTALQIQNMTLGRFKYGAVGSNFYNACTKEIPNPNGDDPKTIRERISFDGNSPEAKKNRKRAAEALRRDYLAYRFKTDYNGKDPIKRAGATDAMCRMAGATIMEQGELGQVVTEEATDSAPLVINQNDVLRGLGEARKKETLRIEFTGDAGSTIKFHFKVKGADGKEHDIIYSTNLERQKTRPAIVGHISKKDAAKVGKTMKPLTPLPEDIFYEFLKGQQALLETLLTSSRERHSFQV